MGLRWRRDPPGEPGLYLYMGDQAPVYRPFVIKFGNWKLGMDPGLLHANGRPVTRLQPGQWLGPLPLATIAGVKSGQDA